ncbi:hypothetical protein B1R94_28805 [Mycolicibacterium litorale]|nr:hypothetical protein B1R94_28805 [Mycolicibacterium litorale]
MTSLRDQAEAFFAAVRAAPSAGAPVKPYPVELVITTANECILVAFREGQPGPAAELPRDAAPGYWTLELRGEREVFEGIFAGALTLGEAFYAGILVAPEEKSKHNLTSAIGQTIRLTQELHRRAKDPRRVAAASMKPKD